MQRVVALAFLVIFHFMAPGVAHATWSVIALDSRSGQIVVASATCVSQAGFARMGASGLRDIQAVVVPGVGVAAAQAAVDRTRANQKLISAELAKGTDPAAILGMLKLDPAIESRQFGILDMKGRHAGW